MMKLRATVTSSKRLCVDFLVNDNQNEIFPQIAQSQVVDGRNGVDGRISGSDHLPCGAKSKVYNTNKHYETVNNSQLELWNEYMHSGNSSVLIKGFWEK